MRPPPEARLLRPVPIERMGYSERPAQHCPGDEGRTDIAQNVVRHRLSVQFGSTFPPLADCVTEKLLADAKAPARAIVLNFILLSLTLRRRAILAVILSYLRRLRDRGDDRLVNSGAAVCCLH